MADTKPSVPSFINEYYAWDEKGSLPPAERAAFEAAQKERLKAYPDEFTQKHAGMNLPMPPRLRPQFFVKEYERWTEGLGKLTPEQQKLADVARRARMMHNLGPGPYDQYLPHIPHPALDYTNKAADVAASKTAERQKRIMTKNKNYPKE